MLIAACIRRMGKGTVFNLFVSPRHSSQGGTLILPDGEGSPSFPMGVPHPSHLANGGTPGYPHQDWMEYPMPGNGWVTPCLGIDGGTPHQDWMGYPPGTGWAYPLPLGLDRVPPPQSGLDGGPLPPSGNRASTCYTAGGMSLAFMQEDFLVLI